MSAAVWQRDNAASAFEVNLSRLVDEIPEADVVSDIAQFFAVPVDRTEEGLVAGEPFKCASPASAIERAKGFWMIFGHAGAAAVVRSGFPLATTIVLRRFGSVPDDLHF